MLKQMFVLFSAVVKDRIRMGEGINNSIMAYLRWLNKLWVLTYDFQIGTNLFQP